MDHHSLVSLLYFYGAFLIISGIVSVMFIGMKAKTAVMSGGMAGLIASGTGFLISNEATGAEAGGILLAFALFCVFAWRSTLTLFKIFELIPSGSEELKGKGIAFLIISLMAIVSMIVFILQVIR